MIYISTYIAKVIDTVFNSKLLYKLSCYGIKHRARDKSNSSWWY